MENEKDILAALDHLEHAGVPGMKWGKRKATSSAGEQKMSRRQKNKAILKAREDAAETSRQVKLLKDAQLTASSKKGKDFISKNLSEKQVKLDAETKAGSKFTTGEKFMAGAGVALLATKVALAYQVSKR